MIRSTSTASQTIYWKRSRKGASGNVQDANSNSQSMLQFSNKHT
jgi:hypothetical protein